ncbi:type IV pilus modification protein PilV [Hydrogenophaga flava]|uniref:type IV pilus modification protein PilV n=1 Tax=Hydrogenophaga flava TaxID=65657 RepID=UPI00082405F7|nr:type IV pilus modification protein PilV [Hydrogenophaga flava]
MNIPTTDYIAPLRQRGASMIEVLVAILLVSVGLLGIAGLSGATFTYNKASQMRLTGMALVNDLADRARVNVYGYDRQGYDIELGDNFESTPVAVGDANLDLDPAVSANADSVADALAAADVDQFLRSVRSRLPQGDAVVTSRPGANARDLDVWLLWKEAATAEGDEDDDRGDFSIFDASKENCPDSLSTEERAEYSCMYFKVGL